MSFVIEKTYQELKNQLVSSDGNALSMSRRVLKAWIDGLLSFATPPTVRYSCDSVVAGTAGDGVNRWDSASDLVWGNAGAAHSWFVLRFSTGVEMLVSCEIAHANGYRLLFGFSPAAGFTGGSTTVRPTAVDEVLVNNGNNSWRRESTDSTRWHLFLSTDHEVMRFFTCVNGYVHGFMEICKAKDPHPNWTTPFYGTYNVEFAANIDATKFGACNQVAGWVKWRHGAVIAQGYFTCESIGQSSTAALPQRQQAFNAVDSYGSAWLVSAMGLFSETAGAWGRPGRVFDLWWAAGPPATLTPDSGDNYPEDGSRVVAQLGNFLVPCGGTVLQVS